ncbi:MAG: class I SAM-dependent methyltransferase [Actinomycetota bacterium]
MDPKTLNALVHDREAALYDERFAIAYDSRIGAIVRQDLERITGEPIKARRALDYCCGTGFASVGLSIAELAEEVHACDLSFNMCVRTHRNADAVGAHVITTLADGERLPYSSGAFDLIVARGALHHLPSPVEALRECRRVLEPGGSIIVLAEPTASGERQVAAIVGNLARVIERTRAILKRPVDEEHHQWELASMAANLHTFTPSSLESLAREAGFTDVRTSTAWWSWVLTLGLNYYLAGESNIIESNPIAKRVRYAAVDAARLLDRIVLEAMIPPRFRHTVQAVLR